MTYTEAKYLKHAGDVINVKVTIKIVDKQPAIYIRDLEIYSFKQALEYLRHIADTELSRVDINVI